MELISFNRFLMLLLDYYLFLVNILSLTEFAFKLDLKKKHLAK